MKPAQKTEVRIKNVLSTFLKALCVAPDYFVNEPAMKNTVLALIAVLVVSSAFALDLTTRDGTVYTDVEIRRVEPDGITIKHSSGLVKIHARNLSDEDRERFHLTPEAARAYVSQQKQARARYASAATHAEALQREERAQSLAEARTTAAQVKRQFDLESAARSYTLYCISLTQWGVFCRDARGGQFLIPHWSATPGKWFHLRAVPGAFVRVSVDVQGTLLTPVGFDPNGPNVILRKDSF